MHEKTKRLICVLHLSVIAACGCGALEGVPDPVVVQSSGQNRGESQPTIARSRLWLDEEAARMAMALLGYSEPEDEVYAIRWENSDWHGTAELLSPETSEPISFDLGPPPERQSINPDFAVESGWLVVAIRRLSDRKEKSYAVRIDQEFTLRKEGHTKTRGYRTRKGVLVRSPSDADPEGSPRQILHQGNNDYIGLENESSGNSAPWLTLRLGPARSEGAGDTE